MSSSLAAQLDTALRAAGIPIIGVQVGADEDKRTWIAQYANTATAQQKQQGDALIAAFDPKAPSAIAADLELSAIEFIDHDKALGAMMRVIYKYLPVGKPATFGAFSDEIRALYKTL